VNALQLEASPASPQLFWVAIGQICTAWARVPRCAYRVAQLIAALWKRNSYAKS